MNKKSYKEYTLHSAFSLLELIIVIVLISIINSISIPKNKISKLDLASDKILLYLNYTRYIAHIDNKFDIEDDKWFKKRWTLKFKNCNESIGGIYYSVFSDTNYGGRINKDECLKDPITNKYLFSNGCKEDSLNDKSKYILLTKEFGVEKVEVSCYRGTGLGYISFGYDGKVYSYIGDTPKEIITPCSIKLYDKYDNFSTIVIEPKTGYIYKL